MGHDHSNNQSERVEAIRARVVDLQQRTRTITVSQAETERDLVYMLTAYDALRAEQRQADGALADAGSVPTGNLANGIRALTAERDALRAERDRYKHDAEGLAATQCEDPVTDEDGHVHCLKVDALQARLTAAAVYLDCNLAGTLEEPRCGDCLVDRRKQVRQAEAREAALREALKVGIGLVSFLGGKDGLHPTPTGQSWIDHAQALADKGIQDA